MTKAKLNKSKSYQGYIIKYFKVIKLELDFINHLTQEFNKDTRHLFCHILISTIINFKRSEFELNEERWIPISSELIKDKLRGASWKVLEEAGLIEVTGYLNPGLSRHFKVSDLIIDEFLEIGDISFEERRKLDKYNLFDSKKSFKKLTHQKYDENRNPIPLLISSAMDLIKECIFNKTAIEAHLADLKEKKEQALKNYGNKDSKYKKARGVYINDSTCFKVIANEHAVKLTSDLWVYSPAYQVQEASGRISHIQGGLQSASRRMKAAAYLGIDQLKNYDLKSSQVNGLIQQFELANLDISWLENYRDNPTAKKDYAAQIGISVDCWKDCLCSLIFGASISSHKNTKLKNKLVKYSDYTEEEEKRDKLNAIVNYLYKEAQGDIDKTLQYLDKFNQAVAPFKAELDKWHQWLVDVWALKMGYAAKDGKRYVKNPTGITLCITDLEEQHNDWKVKTKLAVFVLQGQEAAFIHQLTLLSLQYDYQILGNEHDGVICLGAIPQEAVDKAAQMSGLKFAFLEEKPLERIEEIKRFLA